MAIINKLTAASVKEARLDKGKSQMKFTDGNGLYLLVKPSGKYWRMNYRFGYKQKTLSIGVYPEVSLKEARTKRDEARKLLADYIDPSQNKQANKRLEFAKANASTFEGVAREFIEQKSKTWSITYAHDSTRRLEKYIFPWLGKVKVELIKTPDLLSCLRRIESLGSIEAAHKTRMLCGQVFRYSIAIGICDYDPVQALKGALQSKNTKHRACLTNSKEVGALMRAIKGFEGTLVVKCALMLSPLVFVRPGELRQAEWQEINFEKKEWRIPATKMKMKAVHVVPLSNQSIDVLKEVQALTGGGRYVFPNIRKPSRAMSENTINNALQRLGYDTKEEHCAHGFRGMVSTLLHEEGFDTDVIERQLAHKEGNAIKAAYNHARHLPERIAMMQQWADYLDDLSNGADVISIQRKA
ncbi:MAG: tyrosine-type recombinase/integrase [Mariprofundaceae bacterium]